MIIGDVRSQDRSAPICGRVGFIARALRSEAVRFAILAAVSFAGHIALVSALHELLGLPGAIAVPIAMGFVTLFNFMMLRKCVFGSTNADWLGEMARFIASIAGFRATEYVVFLVLSGGLGLPYLPTYIGILMTSMVCKFLFLRTVLFAKPMAIGASAPE
jgi:putative flippase GtrA